MDRLSTDSSADEGVLHDMKFQPALPLSRFHSKQTVFAFAEGRWVSVYSEPHRLDREHFTESNLTADASDAFALTEPKPGEEAIRAARTALAGATAR